MRTTPQIHYAFDPKESNDRRLVERNFRFDVYLAKLEIQASRFDLPLSDVLATLEEEA